MKLGLEGRVVVNGKVLGNPSAAPNPLLSGLTKDDRCLSYMYRSYSVVIGLSLCRTLERDWSNRSRRNEWDTCKYLQGYQGIYILSLFFLFCFVIFFVYFLWGRTSIRSGASRGVRVLNERDAHSRRVRVTLPRKRVLSQGQRGDSIAYVVRCWQF